MKTLIKKDLVLIFLLKFFHFQWFNSLENVFKVALRRLASAKWGPACGQACIAVDYLLVEDKFASSLVCRMIIGKLSTVPLNFDTLSIVPLSFYYYQWHPCIIKRFTTVTFLTFFVQNRSKPLTFVDDWWLESSFNRGCRWIEVERVKIWVRDLATSRRIWRR